jgi:hypothetical protein
MMHVWLLGRVVSWCVLFHAAKGWAWGLQQALAEFCPCQYRLLLLHVECCIAVCHA